MGKEELSFLNEALYLLLLASSSTKFRQNGRRIISEVLSVEEVIGKLTQHHSEEIVEALAICMCAGYSYGVLLICTNVMMRRLSSKGVDTDLQSTCTLQLRCLLFLGIAKKSFKSY